MNIELAIEGGTPMNIEPNQLFTKGKHYVQNKTR